MKTNGKIFGEHGIPKIKGTFCASSEVEINIYLITIKKSVLQKKNKQREE